MDPFLVSAAALLILIVVGLVWAIRTLYALGQDRRWSWWILSSPIAVIAAVALVLLMPPATFLDKSGEFETIAIGLLEQPESTVEELEIGQFDISSAMSCGRMSLLHRQRQHVHHLEWVGVLAQRPTIGVR